MIIIKNIPKFGNEGECVSFDTIKFIDKDIDMKVVNALKIAYRLGRSFSNDEIKAIASQYKNTTVEDIKTIINAIANAYTIDEEISIPDKHSKGDSGNNGNNGNKINDTER